jgi:hypothetical protein
MPTLPAEFTKVILIFESVFSKRVWRHAQVLIAGALLAVGQCTVGAVLQSNSGPPSPTPSPGSGAGCGAIHISPPPGPTPTWLKSLATSSIA